MEHGVVHFDIPATDPEKLTKFYTDLFGWQIMKFPMQGGDYYLAMTVETDPATQLPKTPGAINGGFYTRQSADDRPMNHVNVENVDEYVAKATGLGATVIVPKMAIPTIGWNAIILDPDGNALGLFQTDPSAA
jgi:predicted enzyme related to lactoylglutathione lyase